jgi:hypothetical protein
MSRGSAARERGTNMNIVEILERIATTLEGLQSPLVRIAMFIVFVCGLLTVIRRIIKTH